MRTLDRRLRVLEQTIRSSYMLRTFCPSEDNPDVFRECCRWDGVTIAHAFDQRREWSRGEIEELAARGETVEILTPEYMAELKQELVEFHQQLEDRWKSEGLI